MGHCGHPRRRDHQAARTVNRLVADFLRQLPDLATVGVPDGTKTLVDDLAEDMRRAEWSLPEPFQSVSSPSTASAESHGARNPCVRLGVVSPFCDDQTFIDARRSGQRRKSPSSSGDPTNSPRCPAPRSMALPAWPCSTKWRPRKMARRRTQRPQGSMPRRSSPNAAGTPRSRSARETPRGRRC